MSRGSYNSLYSGRRWRKLRTYQLAIQPACEMCKARGIWTLATVCDHVTPHRGDLTAFWAGPFQSLCQACHSGDKQRIERGGKPKSRYGLDGWKVEEN